MLVNGESVFALGLFGVCLFTCLFFLSHCCICLPESHQFACVKSVQCRGEKIALIKIRRFYRYKKKKKKKSVHTKSGVRLGHNQDSLIDKQNA